MSNKKQLLISAALVIVAAGLVIIYAMKRQPEQEQTAEGHQHGAPGVQAPAAPVRLDAQSARRIGVTYATVEWGALQAVVRTVGQITFDETRLVNLNPKIEGWVEQLYTDFTGAPVQRGQAMLAVYSPMLVAAQEELILARKLLESASGSAAATENARELLESARRRLTYWDISGAEIERIERTATPQRTLTVRAPASGVIVEKNVFKGQRIMPGMDLFRIADLSTVWLEGEVFEKDLALVTVGRTAQITFEAYPGETYTGRVTYVYPTISPQSRTGRIRIELPNPRLRFKPGMYANVQYDVPVHREGIHIPRSAVLQTGERSVVFVRATDGSLVPREITIGLSSGNHVEVVQGLKPGEVVVASANFLIDAESNLRAAIGSMQQQSDPHAKH